MVATTVDARTRHRANPDRRGRLVYEPVGGARKLFFATDPEILLDGPAGTGKSLACLKKLDRNAVKYPGSRQLIIRKTRTSLTQSALITFDRQVVIPGGRVRFHTTLQAYLYPNGSVIVVGGLDKDSKVMSSEYDTIYCQEATELELSDWEALTTRLRNGAIPHQQLIGDCNPGPPSHWLNQRCIKGQTRRILSRHVDNPMLWDRNAQQWTERGQDYLDRLGRLSGVRLARLFEGKWVAAEGQVLDRFDRAVHVIRRDQLKALGLATPKRYVAGVDWGWTKPGSIEVAAIGGDGQIAIVHEVYQTRRTQDWWVAKAIILRDAYNVETFVCDPSEPAYIAAFQAAGLKAVGAENAILPGITAIQERLTVNDDGRARLYIVEDALEEVDMALREDAQPTCLAEEIDSYVWAKNGAGRREKPVDEFNHGIDPLRYLTLYVDGPQPAKWSDINPDALAAYLIGV